MEFHVLTIYLLLFLKDFSECENAESSAIRNQHKYPESGILLNKLIPQKIYAVPHMVAKVNPGQLNLNLNNGMNNVPKIIIPVAKQQKNMMSTKVPPFKETKASTTNINQEQPKQSKKPDKPAPPIVKNTLPNIQQEKETNPKDVQEVVDRREPKDINAKKETSDKLMQQKPQTITNEKESKMDSDASKNAQSSQTSSQGKTKPDDSSNTPPIVTNKDSESAPKFENKYNQERENTTQLANNGINEFTSGRRYNIDNKETVPNLMDNIAKDTIPITIYKLDDITDSYPESTNSEQVYPGESDYSLNQATSNMIIKNQDVEELCERSLDDMGQYQNDFNQPQYCYNYELPTYNTYYQNSIYDPKFLSSLYSRDKIWRNWKSTEIYISKYEPEGKFNEFDNGFYMPIMNGDIGYEYKKNTPLYHSYVYPI